MCSSLADSTKDIRIDSVSFSPRLFAEFTLLMVNVGIGKQDEVAKWPEETALRSDVQLHMFDFPDEGRLRDLLGTGEEVLEHQEQPGGLQPPCGVRGGIRGGVQACRPRAQPPQSLQTGGGQAAGAEIQRDIVSMLGKAREQRAVKVLCDLVQRVRLTASTCLRPLLASRSGRSRSPSGHQGGGRFWKSTSRRKVSVMPSHGDDRRAGRRRR